MTTLAAAADSPLSLASALRGRELGGYRLITELGSGGMGTVFFAEATGATGRAAVKVLDPRFSADAGLVERFFNEARAVNAIRHPNIVQVHDFGTQEGIYFLVMELLEGETLAELLEREGALSLEQVQEIVKQIAAALDACHERAIVHRDLKPENIFLTNEGVKVLDFGIAKLSDAMVTQGRTQTGTVLGTPAYMSPEQCLGEPTLNPKSDLYSLAVLVYEMLTGSAPFVADSFGQYVICHVRDVPTSPRHYKAELPEYVSAAILRGLSKMPAERHGSAGTFYKALCAPERVIPKAPKAPDARSKRIARQLETIMHKRIARGDLRLPSMPETATRALALLRRGAVNFDELTAVLERDPLIAGHLLRVASSPAFGGRAIQSLRQAIPRFGVEPLKEVLLQLSARSVFRSRVARIDDAFRRIWSHGLAVGNVSRALAESFVIDGPDPDAAYMAGLLHDVGKPVVGGFLLELERMGASDALDDSIWREVVLSAHAPIGQMLSERWGLPDEIRAAIGQSAFAPGGRQCVGNVVRFANALVERQGMDMSPINLEGAFDVIEQGRKLLEINIEDEKEAVAMISANLHSLAPPPINDGNSNTQVNR